jgi:hypothetical protein
VVKFELEHWHNLLFAQFEAQPESINAGRCRRLATPKVRYGPSLDDKASTFAIPFKLFKTSFERRVQFCMSSEPLYDLDALGD